MNVFVIHSGSDYEYINENIINKLKNSVNFLMLNTQNSDTRKKVFWKKEVKNYIKQADIVLIVVGKNSAKSKNISWEIKKALEKDKYLVCYKLNEKFEIPQLLYKNALFSEKKQLIPVEAKNVDDIKNIISICSNNDYGLLNQEIEKLDIEHLFEQYKIYLQTSEDLVARRQNVNSFYISINTALFSALGIILTLENTITIKMIIAVLLMIPGIILDLSWIRLLNSYGVLNSSKMRIVSMIEKKLPANLFDAEWGVMSDKLNKQKYVSFTSSEKSIPKIFISIYSAISIMAIIYLLIHLIQKIS